MIYSAKIIVKGNKENKELIRKGFEPEEKNIGKRAKYSVKTTKNKTEFIITAKDAVALKTATTAITNLLRVIEKTR